MPSLANSSALQAGLLSLGMTSTLTACGSMVPRDAGRDAGRETSVSDTGLRDTASADVVSGNCPAISFQPPATLRFRAYDIRFGGAGTSVAQTTLPFGGVFLNSDLILPVTTGTPDASADVSDNATFAPGTSQNFVGLLILAGMPPELPSTDPRVRRRVDGNPLAALGRPGIANWDEAFPGTQDIGFAYTVEGRIDPSACQLNLRLSGAVNRSAGLATNQPFVALPFYGPRADGRYDLAAADFGNEAVAVFQGALSLNLNLRSVPGAAMMESAVLTICENNCGTIAGSSVRRLEVVLTMRPASPSLPDAGIDAGGADAGADTGPEANLDSDVPTDARADASRDPSVD